MNHATVVKGSRQMKPLFVLLPVLSHIYVKLNLFVKFIKFIIKLKRTRTHTIAYPR